jgi:stage IV sporulation protein FB
MLEFPGKIPIRIFPLFWLLAALIGWINTYTYVGTFLWMIVILLSVLIHEYGHALTSLLFGQRARIDLVGLGGLTQRQGPKLKLWKEFLVTFAGPFASILLSLGAYVILQFMTEKETLLFYLVKITFMANLFWTILNLLPVQPLDGGQLLRIILEGLFGIKGIKAALFLSLVFSGLITLYFLMNQALLIGVLFLLLTYESYRSWKETLLMTEKDQDSTLQEDLKEVEMQMQAGRQEQVFPKLQQIRESAQSGLIYVTATEHLAKILKEQGKFQEAYDLLKPLSKYLSAQSLKLLHQLTYQVGNLDEAISTGNRSYQEFPEYDTALLNALCYAQQGEAMPAVGWLETAVRDGMPNLNAVLNKHEFDGIRKTAPFMEFFQRHHKT